MDVAIDPDYAENGWVYLSYSHLRRGDRGKRLSMTRVVRGKIRDGEWVEEQPIYTAPAEFYSTTRHHYGSRLAFDHEGHLLFSIGERGNRPLAQDLFRPNGKIHRVWPDGSVPEDNPFADGKKGLPTVYSYGHRNPQGLCRPPGDGARYGRRSTARWAATR